MDRFLRDWRRRRVHPRSDDHCDDSAGNDEPIDAKEDGGREYLSLENLSMGLECSRHDPALVRDSAVAPSQSRGHTHRRGKFRDIPRTEYNTLGETRGKRRLRFSFQPSHALLEREHLVSHDTEQEFDDGSRKRSIIERGVDTVLDTLVELYDSIVNGVFRGISEPKEVVVHSCSLVIEPLVDGGCVRIVDVVRDVLGEIADDVITNTFSRGLMRASWMSVAAIPTAPMERHMNAGG